MSMGMKIGIIVVAGIIIMAGMMLFGAVVVTKCIGWSNTEIDLRNTFTAQETVCKGFYDKMWKILKSQAQITDKYAKDWLAEINKKIKSTEDIEDILWDLDQALAAAAKEA